jgi:hypothetical protein
LKIPTVAFLSLYSCGDACEGSGPLAYLYGFCRIPALFNEMTASNDKISVNYPRKERREKETYPWIYGPVGRGGYYVRIPLLVSSTRLQALNNSY